MSGAPDASEYQEQPPDEEDQTFLDKLRAALVDSVGLDSLPEPEPLIEDVLYRDSLVWLQGKSGDGKSFVAIDMSGAIGTGTDWHGHAVTQGFVLYLVAEGATGIKPRVRAWEQEHGRTMTGVKFLPVAVQAGITTQWSALRELVRELHPTMVVIDTQARVTVGMEENAAKDMGEFVDKLEKLRKEAGSTVLVVHHQGRNGDHMRGSTALYGSADTELQVSKEDRDVTVKCGKQKNAEEFEDITLLMVPTLTSLVLKLADRSGRGAGRSSAALKMARQWWELFEEETVSASKLMLSLGISETTFFRNVKELVTDGAAIKDTAGRYTRYRLVRDPSED